MQTFYYEAPLIWNWCSEKQMVDEQLLNTVKQQSHNSKAQYTHVNF